MSFKRRFSWGGVLGCVILATHGVAAGQGDAPARNIERDGGSVARPLGKSLAILIGVQDYQNVPKLKYAREDVRLLAETLRKSCRFDHVITLVDDAPEEKNRPTLGNLSARIREWLMVANNGDYSRVLLYFSGHGFRDEGQHLYFAPPDCDRQNLALTALPQAYVKQLLDACDRVRVKFLVLDCCHAGEGRAGIIGVSGADMSAVFKNARGLLVMASCARDQVSLEWAEKGHGLFTYWLCEGLKGAADRNADAIVDHSELKMYVYNHVLESAANMGRSQEVVFQESEGWRGVAALSEVFSVPVDVEHPKSVTAVFTVRAGSDDGPAAPDVAVEVWYRRSKEAEPTKIVEGLTGTDGRLAMKVPLKQSQWLDGHFLAVVRQGQRTKLWRLTDGSRSRFPYARSWKLYLPVEEESNGEDSNGDEWNGEEFTNSLGMRLRKLPTGEFQMGSRKSVEELARIFALDKTETEAFCCDEYPLHTVRITKPFYMGVHEVTVGQFREFVQATNYVTEAERDNRGSYVWTKSGFTLDPQANWKNPGFPQTYEHPVVCVSWNDAVAFTRWLSEKEGIAYSLPTEAQWEYAARAGSATLFSFGENPEKLADNANAADEIAKKEFPAWVTCNREDGYAYTAPVGSFRPNAWKLCDMSGNVWEWCEDRYGDGRYGSSSDRAPTGSSHESSRVIRGGGWDSLAWACRSAERNGNSPDVRRHSLGFRVVCDRPGN